MATESIEPGQTENTLFGSWASEAALRLLERSSGFTTGQRLGPYLIEEKLGEGGMGEVYCALDTRLNRHVALKIVDAAAFGDEAWQNRFFAEARTVAGLSHPNICALYDVGEHYLVMELIEGETLAQRLQRGAVPESEALQLALTLLSALEYAHSEGVIHRDIKPGNVMLTARGIKLLDFGIAWDASQPTDAVQAGTRRYQAFEQQTGAPDPRSDLFSFGLVLFEMMTGHLPRDADLPGGGGGVPKDLTKIIRRCIAVDPNDRWQTAKDLRKELESVVARRTGGPRRFAISAMAVVCAVVVLGLLMTKRSGERQMKSVAVLPLEQVSAVRMPVFFADELTDEIIGRLRNAAGLRVISFHSTAPLRGTKKQIEQIARDLQVQEIIKGTVDRSGDEVRLQLSIFDGQNGAVIANVGRTRSIVEATKLLDGVAQTLAERLDVRLTGRSDQKALTHKVIPAAWSEYARGRQLCTAIFTGGLDSMTPEEASARALVTLEESVRLDPEFAPAHAARASCLWSRMLIGLDSPVQQAPRVRSAALRAITLDRSLGEPYIFLGAVRRDYDWDWEGAESAFRRAIEMEPGSAVAHSQYAVYLDAVGRFREALREASRGKELDPASLMSMIILPWSRVAAADLEGAAREFKSLIDKDSQAGAVYPQLTWVLRKLGRYQEAAATYQKARRFYPAGSDHLMDAWLMDEIIAEAGPAAARNLVAYWRRESKWRYVDPYNLAAMYMALGDEDRVFSLLKKSVLERSPSVFFINVDPWFSAIRQRPAYRELVRDMNLQ